MRSTIGRLPYRVWHPWTSMPTILGHPSLQVAFERAEGSYLYTADGHRMLDGCAGMWNVCLGHARKDMIDAVAEALGALTYSCNIEFPSRRANEFAHELLQTVAPRMSRAMFHCTGTAAVESAILLVRQYFKMIGKPDRVGVVSVTGAYHGCSMLTAAVSGIPNDARWFMPLPEGIAHIGMPSDEASALRSLVEFHDLVDRLGPERIACFVFEPIMGVAGIIEPPRFWLEQILERCRAEGIRVIADEVTTGVGRVGNWLACDDPRVDIIALGKGLSGGYVPLAATLYSDELFTPFGTGVTPEDFKSGSTMDGYPAACAAGLAVISAIQRERLLERAARLGAMLKSRLTALCDQGLCGPIRGRGLMLGVPLIQQGPLGPQPFEPARMRWVIARLLQHGLVLHAVEDSTLAILPPLTVVEAEINEIAEILGGVLSDLRRRTEARSAREVLV